jgi:hypothetical protein
VFILNIPVNPQMVQRSILRPGSFIYTPDVDSQTLFSLKLVRAFFTFEKGAV